MVLTLIFQLLIPFVALADESSAPSLSMNDEGQYTVNSVADLNHLRGDIDKGIDYSRKIVILTEDITISPESPLNSFTTQNTFNGCFDGKSHSIRGYTDAKSGLFSFIDDNGYVRNLRLEANVVIKDQSSIIAENVNKGYGLIANECAGTISCCSTTGTVTNEVPCIVGGIAGYSELFKQRAGENLKGEIRNCYSNVVFDNQVTDTSSGMPYLCGITYWTGVSLEHCYYYGQYKGVALNKTYTQPIVSNTGNADAKTCAYDQDILGFYQAGSSKGKKYSTEQMKTQSSYTALGFDFEKYWSMNSTVNDGYPYLDPSKQDKEAAIQIPVDIQVTVADKTYNPDLSEEENLRAKVEAVQIVEPTDPQTKDLLERYQVQVAYEDPSAKFSPTMGEQSVSVTFAKLTLAYTPNDVYQFTINKVLPATANFQDNGQPGPTEAKRVEQVVLAKKAQEILYSKLGIGQGQVPAFTWSGDQAVAPGKEGTIVFNDSLKADTWGIFSAARSGYTGVRPGYYDEWFQSIQTGLQRMKEAGIGPQDVKMTEWEKLVLAITAIGYDPRDIEAYDLIDIISNEDYLSASKQYFSRQYALLALESLHYSIPKNGNRIDSETWIHTMAEQTKGTTGADGSTVAGNTASDMWVMQFQPIAAYYQPDAQAGDQYYDVKEAMERVFAQFSNAQTYAGYFSGGLDNINNPWTNAQVYITLGMAKADLFDGKYIKNGNSIFDGALGFYDFANNSTSFDETTYEPAQIGRGLDALVRAYEGRNHIFDCTDVAESTVRLNNAVAALPETVTRDDQAAVEAAQALYAGLSAAQKSSLQSATKAKLAAAQLAVRDPSFPVISIKDLADQPLTEDKTVTAAEFRFKVTVEDQEDSTCNPNVEFNGTPLEAEDDGTYNCILSLGNNTLTVTATDMNGNRAEKSLSVILEAAPLLTPPGLSADNTDNIPGETVDLAFSDNPAWRDVINSITINGTSLSDSQYTITAGKIQIHAGVMTTVGNYLIAVMAAGYTDAVVNQAIEPEPTALGTVKVRVADNVQRLASEVGSLGENYRQPFGEILAQTEVEVTPGLTMRGALEKALATKDMTVFGAANYISGIGPVTSADGKRTVARLSEFNGGDQSGWMVTLNDWFINSGANNFVVKDGDVVELYYTCNLGADVGGDFNNPDTSLKTLTISSGTLSPNYSQETKNYVLTLPAATTIIVTPTAANKTNKVIIQSGGNTYRRTDEIAVVNKQVITVTCAENTYKITISIPGSNQDQDRADEVSALIGALPEVNQLTLNDKNLVEAARAAYTALSDAQKELVTNLTRLTAAEETIAGLLEGDKKDDLNSKIAEAELLTETRYTPESWAIFAEKLSAAKLVAGSSAATQTEVSAALENLINAINALMLREGGSKQAEVQDILTTVSGNMRGSGTDWDVVDMAAYGLGGAMNKATLIANALAIYNESEYTPAATDYERVVIALTSLGIDARSVDNGTNGKANFIEKIAQYNAGAPTPSLGTINAYIFALLAYDSGNYELTPTANWTREKIIAYLLSRQLTDGGWALSGSSGDPDVTGMAISALAKYQDDENVEEALAKAVNCLSAMQEATGGFKSWGTENSNSASMVIVALSTLGIDGDQDSRFVKAGKSVLDALLSYKTTDNRLGYTDTTYDAMATEQGFRALVAYSKLLESGGAYNIYVFGTPTSEGSLFDQNQEALNALHNVSSEQRAGAALSGGDTVNPESATGSTLTTGDGLMLSVPPGALSNQSDPIQFIVQIGAITTPPETGYGVRVLDPLLYQRQFTLATAGGSVSEGATQFTTPVVITFPINVSALPAGITPAQLAVYWWNPDSQKWVRVAGSTFDPSTNTLSVPVAHFSTYAVMADIGKPVTQLTIPATVSLKVGDKSQLIAAVTPSDATDQTLSWSSSNSTVVAVDGTGNLTAKQVGTAAVTVKALDGSDVQAICTVTVTAASPGGDPEPDTKISVSFTLKGDSVHGTPGKHTAFQTWISPTIVSVDKDSTVYDVFAKVLGENGLQYKETQYNYIGGIKAPSSFGGHWLYAFDNGPNSGWMYTVNGTHPNVGLRSYELNDGDVIVWHYTDDYTKEEGGFEDPDVDLTKPVIHTSVVNQETVFTSSYLFTAAAEDNQDGSVPVQVRFNGQLILPGSDGSYRINLAEGPNSITISAADAAGNRVEQSYTIIYSLDPDDEEIIAKVREAIDKVTGYLNHSGYTSDWTVVGRGAAGQTIGPGYLADLEQTIDQYFGETINTGGERVTDHERWSLAILAAGGNPRSIGGHDLIERIYNFYISSSNRDITFQGLNGVIFGLIALDAREYETPQDARYSREWLRSYLLDKQNRDGGWDLGSTGESDVDITGMVLQALAPYYNKAEVKTAVNKAVGWLSAVQGSDGGFASTGTVNSEAVSQAIIALGALGIDPAAEDFTKQDNNLLTALLAFQEKDGSFRHTLSEKTGNDMATEQAYLALLAYDKFIKAGGTYDEGRTSIYYFGETESDKTPPVITTDLTSKSVNLAEYTFSVSAVDAVEGTVPVTVKINGELVLPAGDGQYKVTLVEGENTISLEAKDSKGNAVSLSYTLVYTTKVILVTKIEVSDSAAVQVGETTSLTATVIPGDATDQTLSWSSSDSTVVTVDEDGKLTGKKEGTAVITVEAQDGSGVNALCVVTVSSSGGGTKPGTEISVSFTLKGDSVHGTPEKHKAFQTWIPKTTVSMDKDSTVYDLFVKVLGNNGIQYKETQPNYIGGIKAPASFGGHWLYEFDNGPNSGWMYTVNGKHPNLGLRDRKLKDGDVVVWHYTDDYTKEEGSEKWNTGGSSTGTSTKKPLPEEVPVTADAKTLNQINQEALAVLNNLTAEQQARAALPADAPQLNPGAGTETLLTAADGVQLRVPAGALNNQNSPLTLSIGIGRITTPPQGERGIRVLNPLQYQRQFELAGSAGTLTEGAVRFTAPVTLTFPITTGELPEGVTTGQLAVYWWNPNRSDWVRLGGVFDALTNTLAIPIYHLSTYAMMADQSSTPQRLAGKDRFLTANAVADQGWKTGADEVILVNAVTFADALAAGPLAFKLNAPILLTEKETLTPFTREEIKKLGAKRITLIGGTGVISQGIEMELQTSYGAENVQRYGGYDRYETAALIAAALGTTGQAILASGEDGHYSDALAISSYAAYHGIPILFTESGALPEATAQALAARKVSTTIVVGGEAVIPAPIYNRLPGASRYAGMDSYATAAAIAEGLKLNPNRTYIATGLNFADALTAGNLAAQTLSPLLMVDRNVPQASADYLTSHQGKISELVIIGGEGIIRADQESVLRAALSPASQSE